MSDYRRAIVPGGCLFFTPVTQGRQRLFVDEQNVDRCPTAIAIIPSAGG